MLSSSPCSCHRATGKIRRTSKTAKRDTPTHTKSAQARRVGVRHEISLLCMSKKLCPWIVDGGRHLKGKYYYY
eukprot:scaffold27982_cov31-Tisochrysis_lutea.AAC.8